jgi:hypothetical protein
MLAREFAKGGETLTTQAKKSYRRPRLEVFGTVTELTLNACNTPGADGKTCREHTPAAGEEGRSTPGSIQPPFG